MKIKLLCLIIALWMSVSSVSAQVTSETQRMFICLGEDYLVDNLRQVKNKAEFLLTEIEEPAGCTYQDIPLESEVLVVSLDSYVNPYGMRFEVVRLKEPNGMIWMSAKMQ